MGKQYITSNATIKASRHKSGELPVANIIGSSDAYLLPNAEVMEMILANIVSAAIGSPRQEHGGIVSNTGEFEGNPPGPIATGAEAEIDLTPSIQATQAKGQTPQLIIHSHTSFSLGGQQSSIEFNENPTAKDVGLAGRYQAQGLVIYPTNQVPAAAKATFFSGTFGTSVSTSWYILQKIVDGGKK